ncbi:hypothetical protein AB3S75_041587 [Citrus x aurantiifolia]
MPSLLRPPPSMANNHEVLYNQELEHYLCRKCSTNICLLRDCAYVHREFKTVHTATLDNVVLDTTPENRIMLRGHILEVVQCSGCHKELGRKCIQEGNHSTYLYDYEEGKIGLNLKSLLFWDGNKMLEAKILKPWDGNNLEEWEMELNEDDLT